MKKHQTFKLYLSLLLFCCSAIVYAGDWTHRGQLSGWLGGAQNKDNSSHQIGLRYLPEGAALFDLNDNIFMEARLSLNMYVAALNGKGQQDLKLYRLQWRLNTDQSELRIGLQKISFGPAQLLRSLRWFDQIDPQDPLNLTSGVYALRYKYGFINNANIWLWALYGNTKTKGLELYPSKKGTPEFGGRLQLPVPGGEVAVSGHSRTTATQNFNYIENRLAIDLRMDFILGWWFETVIQESKTSQLKYPWQKLFSIGTDFTFAWGNGLYFLVEHMSASASAKAADYDQTIHTSAVSLSYPVGIFDSVRSIVYYSWESEKLFQYYSWQRTFDDFILNLGLFNYPSVQGLTGNLPVSGYGLQLMFIYNY